MESMGIYDGMIGNVMVEKYKYISTKSDCGIEIPGNTSSILGLQFTEISNYSEQPYTNYRYRCSDSFTILGLWVLGLATSNINESPLQTNESKTLFLMTSLPYYCIPGLAEIKTYAQKMQDAQVTKSLQMSKQNHNLEQR